MYYPVYYPTQLYNNRNPSAPPMDQHVVPGENRSIPVQSWSNLQESANQAYIQAQADFPILNQLPPLNLNDKSIQTLKQIEEKAKQGIISNLLTLMIKVLQVVGKLALGLAVGTSVALILSALFGLPVAVFLSAMTFPIWGGALLVRLTCKVSAWALSGLKQAWINHCFRSAIKAEKERILPLKAWRQLKDLPQIEQRLQTAVQQLTLAQQYTSFPALLGQQLAYVESQLRKIHHFHIINQQLSGKNAFSLLNDYLNG